jgi:hypothetical protein
MMAHNHRVAGEGHPPRLPQNVACSPVPRSSEVGSQHGDSLRLRIRSLQGATLHGSGRVDFPRAAVALGNSARAAQRISMTDGRPGQPASDQRPHAVPEDATVLAAPRQRAVPEPAHWEPKSPQRGGVQGHSAVPDVSSHRRLQPLAQLGDGGVHASLKFGSHLVPFACNLLRIVCRNTVNRPLLLFFTQICVKSKKLNVSRFHFPMRPNPLSPAASASWREVSFAAQYLVRTRSPVSASTPPLRAAPHDSGPMGGADPPTSIVRLSSIHYTSPV